MPKSAAKGGKNRKKGKSNAEGVKRELITREDGQEYGICTAMHGCNRMTVHLFTGQDCIGVIRGKIVRRMWINLGNVVLCGNREFEAGSPKVDIILRYSQEEAAELQKMGEIPDISRWTVVGRGGMVEEAEDAGGNIKFAAAAGDNNKGATRVNDGWDMPSSDDEEGEEDEEEEDGEEDEEEEEILPDEMTLGGGKDDRHKGKTEGKRKDREANANAKDNRKGIVKEEKKKPPQQPAVPQRAAAPQASTAKKQVQKPAYQHGMNLGGDDDLDIDNI